MAIIDVVISMEGSLSSEIAYQNLTTVAPISFEGNLQAVVSYQNLTNIAPISMKATLDATVSFVTLQNLVVSMGGSLTSEFNYISCQVCNDIFVDFEPETIYALGCNMAKKKPTFTRTRGDNYPVPAVLALKGNYDLSGFTSIKLSTQIGAEIVFTVDATIINAALGMVEFPLTAPQVAIAGYGAIDIQGVLGTYTYTFYNGIFVLNDDVTV